MNYKQNEFSMSRNRITLTEKLKYCSLIFSLVIFFNQQSFGQTSKKSLAKTDSTKSENSILADTTKTSIPKIFLKVIAPNSLLDNSFSGNKIHKSKLESIDYRFTEDFLNEVPGVFIKKLGNGGSPTDVSLYGLDNRSTAILNDGINVTNRLTNLADLHLFQSESIDSIEILPLSRGFMYSNSGVASINFISRIPASNRPYSRLKYYQAPAGEGLIDGIFNISPFKKLNTYIELTNHGADAYFKNSNFSTWMGNFRMDYMLSQNATIRLNYKHTKSTTALNGGVDVEATHNNYPNDPINELIYDYQYASVRYLNRYITTTNNFFSASVFSKLIGNSPTELSFYYKDDLAEFRQNINGSIQDNVLPVSHDNQSITLGGRLRQDLSTDFFNLTSLTNFERNRFDSPLFEKEITRTIFSTSAIATLKLADDYILPSGFFQYQNISQKNYLGFGADAIVKIYDAVSIYAGLAHFEQPISPLEKRFLKITNINENRQIQTAELKASFSFNPLTISLGYFMVKNDNEFVGAFIESNERNDAAYFVDAVNSTSHGISLNANVKIWKVVLNSSSTLYLSEDERIRRGLPQFYSTGGAYYIDTLFNNNLKLKTGFNYYSYGSRYEQHFDFEKGVSSSFIYNSTNGSYSQINALEFTPSFQIDFFLAGRIQDSAIIYFTWENLLNSQYSVVPFYPVRPRGLRFGVAWEFLD